MLKRVTVNIPPELVAAINADSRKHNRKWSSVIVLALARQYHIDLSEELFKPGPRGARTVAPNKPAVMEPPPAATRRGRKPRKTVVEVTDYAF